MTTNNFRFDELATKLDALSKEYSEFEVIAIIHDNDNIVRSLSTPSHVNALIMINAFLKQLGNQEHKISVTELVKGDQREH